VDAVGCGMMFSGVITNFVFNIFQIPSGCSAPTFTPPPGLVGFMVYGVHRVHRPFLAITIPQTSPYSIFNLPRTLYDLSNTPLSALKKEAVLPSETLIYSVCFCSTAVSQPNGLLRSHKCLRSECSYTRP